MGSTCAGGSGAHGTYVAGGAVASVETDPQAVRNAAARAVTIALT
jgi:hypothetical protein